MRIETSNEPSKTDGRCSQKVFKWRQQIGKRSLGCPPTRWMDNLVKTTQSRWVWVPTPQATRGEKRNPMIMNRKNSNTLCASLKSNKR